ncbi:MAG: hypothetical protein LBI39_00570 [Puniceicoccales bacterium]|nr:hypothetical protein [Puniceicoccales bacterium]
MNQGAIELKSPIRLEDNRPYETVVVRHERSGIGILLHCTGRAVIKKIGGWPYCVAIIPSSEEDMRNMLAIKLANCGKNIYQFLSTSPAHSPPPTTGRTRRASSIF